MQLTVSEEDNSNLKVLVFVCFCLELLYRSLKFALRVIFKYVSHVRCKKIYLHQTPSAIRSLGTFLDDFAAIITM